MGGRRRDITGQRFGKLVVQGFSHSAKNVAHWFCRCDCGVEKVIAGPSLYKGRSKTCGCSRAESLRLAYEARRVDLVGLRFGRLLCIERSGSANGKALWSCLCECGRETRVPTGDLRAGKSKSCGCLNREIVNAAKTTHGASKTPEYKSWAHILDRCTNPRNKSWKDYGGRGITVCERWRSSFSNFLADVGPRPTRDLSIDRINNEGNYEPGNCRWATRTEQNRNQRPKARKGRVS